MAGLPRLTSALRPLLLRGRTAQPTLRRTVAVCRGGSPAAAVWCRGYAARPADTVDQPSYAHLARGSYAQVTEEDIASLSAIVSGRLLTEQADVEPFNADWMGKFRGRSKVVVRPRTTAEVSEVMSFCHSRGLAVCPQGGNTGLVGGSVPVFDEVVISLSLMNKVTSLDEISGILVCQAGCILQTLDEYLKERDFMMPLDLGAKGSCQIGGNVSTNAGGIRLLRYGSLHGSVLGVEAVLADGTVMDTLSTLRKDNTGYDLKQLFIGSEGTLGIVTNVSISVPKLPQAVNVAFLGCRDFDSVLSTFALSKAHLSEILSAFEFMDHESMTLSERHLGSRNPVATPFPFYVLIETHGSNSTHDEEKLEGLLEAAMEAGHVADGVVAQGPGQAHEFWQIREELASAVKHEGVMYKYDVSLPVPVLYTLVEEMRARLGELATACVGYGHLGDGNLHLNVTSKEHSEEVLSIIEPFVYDFTAEHKGSISAEHGLGVMKPNHMHYSKSQPAIELMQQIKGLMDPHGLLNPYKTIPAATPRT